MTSMYGHTPTGPGHPLGSGFNYTLLAVYSDFEDTAITKIPLAMYHSFDGLMSDIDNGYAGQWAAQRRETGKRLTGYDYAAREE